jgi:hypothetical protein
MMSPRRWKGWAKIDAEEPQEELEETTKNCL